ncbi:sensor histidine kinase [Puniceicoccaceae bacterium K14]|nr:sensor histidine kinase [Puniceicoccaceae bacterium K14]
MMTTPEETTRSKDLPIQPLLNRKRIEKWWDWLCYFVCGSCIVLTPLQGIRSPNWLVELVIYSIAVISFTLLWLYYGRLTETQAEASQEESATLLNSWGSPRELVVLLVGIAPLTYIVIFYSITRFDYFGFNHVLLFVLAALSTYAMPSWAVAATIGVELLLFQLLAVGFMDRGLRIDEALGLGSGIAFTCILSYSLRNEARARSLVERLAGDLEEANNRLRHYSVKIEDLASTEERNRIARDYHDTIGHCLTVVNVQLEAADALFEKNPAKARSFMRKARELTQKGLQSVRSSVSSMRKSPLDGTTLIEALNNLTEQMRQSNIPCHFKLSGHERTLEQATALALFRTAQEAFTNIHKYAEASAVEIELDFSNTQQIRLVINDDGLGCENPIDGYGLIGIRERIHFLKGRVIIETEKNKGFTIETIIPIL